MRNRFFPKDGKHTKLTCFRIHGWALCHGWRGRQAPFGDILGTGCPVRIGQVERDTKIVAQAFVGDPAQVFEQFATVFEIDPQHPRFLVLHNTLCYYSSIAREQRPIN